MSVVRNEEVDKVICDKLADLKFSSFYEIMKECPRYYDCKKERFLKPDNKPLETIYNEIKIYCKTARKHKHKQKITYDYGKGYTSGRLYSKNGVAGMLREFRSCLLGKQYNDFDMKNCHPVILLKLCENKNIQCDYLRRYINERDAFFEEYCQKDKITRDEAKTMVIKFINSDTNRTNDIKYKDAQNLNKELIKIQNAFLELEEFEDIKKYVIEKKNVNIGGRVLNHILFKKEGELLERAYKTLEKEFDIVVDILIFDGFLIKKSFINGTAEIKNVIEKLNDITKDYNVKWDCKQQDSFLYESILLLNEDDKESNIEGFEYIQADSLLDISQSLLTNNLKDKLVVCNDEVYFKSCNLWISSEKTIKKELIKYLITLDLFVQETFSDGRFINKRVTSLKDYNEIYAFLVINCEVNDDLLNDIFDYTINKLYFKNGYYDGIQNKFIYTTNFNTFVKINKTFDSSNDYKEEKKDLMKKIFNPIFTIDKKRDDYEVRQQLFKNWLHRIARSIFGHIEDKLFYTVEGERDCGKGVLQDLIINTFGDYITITNSENFLIKKNDNNDEAKANSFMVPFQFKRLVCASEFKLKEDIVNNKKVVRKVDGNTIKKMISGGDRIQARLNFKDETIFRIQCGLSFAINDFPDINPSDCNEKRVSYVLKTKFIDKSFKSTKLKQIMYKVKDDSVKNIFIKKESVQMAFFDMIKEALFNPVEFPETLFEEQRTEDTDNGVDQFFDLFNYETDEKLSLKQIEIHCRNNDILYNKSKIKRMLLDKGLEVKKLNSGLNVLKIGFKNTDSGYDDDE